MTYTPPRTEPLEITAGDSWQWTKSLPKFPATDGWTLRYYLRGSGTIDITATANGADYAVNVAPADTATKNPGSYTWTAKVSNGIDTHTVGGGTICVKPDLSTASGSHDGRSYARRMLDNLRDLYAGRVTSENSEIEIHGRKAVKLSPAEIRAEMQRWQTVVNRENRKKQKRYVATFQPSNNGPIPYDRRFARS